MDEIRKQRITIVLPYSRFTVQQLQMLLLSCDAVRKQLDRKLRGSLTLHFDGKGGLDIRNFVVEDHAEASLSEGAEIIYGPSD